MTATMDAKALLDAAGLTGIDAIYTENLPGEEKTNTDRTVVLLTDSDLVPEVYGDNDFHAVNREIELQIWYALTPVEDPEAIEVALMHAMVAAHWQVTANRHRTADPGTFQLSKTIYFAQTKILGG